MVNILKFITLMMLLISSLQAGVKATVDYPTVEVGEMVTYSLELSGDDIQRPVIQRLCESDVISTASNTAMNIINGSITRAYVLSYKFIPQKSCKIQPVAVTINDKVEYSNVVDVKVSPLSATKDKEYELQLISDKKSVLVGESFNVDLIFKQKRNAKGVDSKFVPPELKGFWVKKEFRPVRSDDGNYSVTKLRYTLAAQRVGSLHVGKAQMSIASRSNKRDFYGSFVPSIKWKTYFSNALDIDVQALPSGISLVGDFKISLHVDKKVVDANEAINIEIKVVGDGNLEDISTFKPFIKDVSVFDEKIVVNGLKLTQKIAFVSENDFIIPAFTIKYFDTKTKKVKTISTQEIDIKVKGSQVKEKELVIKKEINSIESNEPQFIQVETNKITLAFVFIAGLLAGILLMLIKPFSFSKKEKQVSLKDPKVLLMKLLPFRADDEVQKIVDELEQSIYSKKPLDLDKKQLKEIFKKYDI